MDLRSNIEITLNFVKEKIEENKEKSRTTDSDRMRYYYDGIVVALELTQNMLEYDLKE